MTATGASAAIGAAVGIGAGMVTTIATVAFTVTGISEKINKAATKVFGEDLVMVGNIFGAAYGAFSGGFGATGAEPGAAVDAVNGMDLASDQFTAAASGGAGDFGSLADMAGESLDSMSSMADSAYGGEAAMESAQLSGMDSMAPSQTLSPMASGGQDLLNGNGVNGPELEAVAEVPGVQEVAPTTKTVKAEGAVAAEATKAQPAAAAKPIASATKAAAPQAGGRSFFERLIYDEKGNVSRGAWGALEGVGKGISAASAAKDKRKQFEDEMNEQRRRMGMSTGLTVTR